MPSHLNSHSSFLFTKADVQRVVVVLISVIETRQLSVFNNAKPSQTKISFYLGIEVDDALEVTELTEV